MTARVLGRWLPAWAAIVAGVVVGAAVVLPASAATSCVPARSLSEAFAQTRTVDGRTEVRVVTPMRFRCGDRWAGPVGGANVSPWAPLPVVTP